MFDICIVTGLFFEIIGVVFLFKLVHDDTLMAHGTPQEIMYQVQAHARKKRIAEWSLGVIIVGSSLQIVYAINNAVNVVE